MGGSQANTFQEIQNEVANKFSSYQGTTVKYFCYDLCNRGSQVMPNDCDVIVLNSFDNYLYRNKGCMDRNIGCKVFV